MDGSKTLAWLQTGTVRKKRAHQEENISSSCVESEADDRKPSASGYLSNAREVSTVPLAANGTKRSEDLTQVTAILDSVGAGRRNSPGRSVRRSQSTGRMYRASLHIAKAGRASCILLFEKIIPFLSGKSTIGLEVPAVQKQKTQ